MCYLISKFKAIVLFLFVIIISCSNNNLDHDKQIANLMDKYYEVGLFKGSVLVAHNNEVVFEKGYGEANREWQINNTIDTKFRLGSATKPFTAVLTMKLVEEGKINLDGTISDYLSDFRQDIGQKVTIYHLLTHSSGIGLPKMSADEYWDFFQKEWTTKELVKKLCSGELKFEPGSEFQYSSAGHILLGAIMEEVTGLSHEQILKEYILEPYGLKDTGVDYPDKILSKRADGYQTNYGLGNARYKYMPSSHASGSMYSTVEDLYKWDQLLRSDFLSDESKDRMFSHQIESHRGSFGLGWFIDTVRVDNTYQTRVFHAGDVSGFCALYVSVLETGDFVALLANQEGINYYDIAFTILDMLNGIIPEDPKEYLSDRLRITYFDQGIDSLKSLYAKLSQTALNDFTIVEDEIIELGYDVLFVGDIISAIEIFKINVKLHPNSSNAFDSLGEGYLEHGNYQAALHNYQKALELDPANTNALNMIDKIKSILNK